MIGEAQATGSDGAGDRPADRRGLPLGQRAKASPARDSDAICGRALQWRLQGMGIERVLSVPRSPRQNALAETIIGLFKTEVIRHRGPWRHLEAVVHATGEWVDWFNHRRLLEPMGNVPPAELGLAHQRQQGEPALANRSGNVCGAPVLPFRRSPRSSAHLSTDRSQGVFQVRLFSAATAFQSTA
jgi:hypothetical protein